MRIGVNIPDDLYQRMKHIKHTVNVSQVCREAIEAYVEDYERARARLESDGADEMVKRLSGLLGCPARRKIELWTGKSLAGKTREIGWRG